jgi:hypothetical protein
VFRKPLVLEIPSFVSLISFSLISKWDVEALCTFQSNLLVSVLSLPFSFPSFLPSFFPSLLSLLLFCIVLDRILLCSPAWPWTHDPPTSASHVLWLQLCTIMPGYFLVSLKTMVCLKVSIFSLPRRNGNLSCVVCAVRAEHGCHDISCFWVTLFYFCTVQIDGWSLHVQCCQGFKAIC